MFVPGYPACCQLVLVVFQRVFCAPLQTKSYADPETLIARALLVE